MDSILLSIKRLLGPAEDYDHFDPDILFHINAALGVLYQLGVGSYADGKQFRITSDQEKWTDFLPEDQIDVAKEYVYAKVKLAFDPPANSFTVQALKDLIAEMEWRANVHAETP